NRLAVRAARRSFHLPYFNAQMTCAVSNDWIHYRCNRTHRHAFAASFLARYQPIGAPFHPQRDFLEYFLTERYCLYASQGTKLYRGEIHHPPWSLQSALAQVDCNTMAAAAGFDLPDLSPLLHFARRQDMVAWAPQRLA